MGSSFLYFVVVKTKFIYAFFLNKPLEKRGLIMGKKGQIALFVMVSLFLIGAIFLIYNIVTAPTTVPSALRPIDDQIKSCISNAIVDGATILGEQGGYIVLPGFERGSEIYPSTSQFDFFGSAMPFWFYISGNGISQNQAPSISGMEIQLADYVNSQLQWCDFSSLENQGYSINDENSPSTTITIAKSSINAEVEWPVTLSFGDTKKRITSHSVKTNHNLGEMYNTAKKIFDEESSARFLEEYTLDSITLNAPTTDSVISCAPKIWSKQQVSNDIKESLALNLPTIKFTGTYYSLANSERKYFVRTLTSPIVNQKVNIIYSSNFPTYIDISPSDGDVMRADPVGIQKGMELLGFCYVPYHFVYSMNYPVIIQVFDDKDNLFQFPMIIQIVNNNPRGYVPDEQPASIENQICKYKPQEFEVRTVDRNGNPVDSEISLKCAGASCLIGSTEDGVINTGFPQCVNGFVEARKEGYAIALAQVSTDIGGSIEIPMNKIYDLNLEVLANFNTLKENDTALLTFFSNDYAATAYYPTQKRISLPQGSYEISGYLFRSGKIELSAQTTQNCVDVPRDGVAGLLGFKTSQCYDISTPSQELTQITIGGGNVQQEFSENQLRQSNTLEVSIPAQTPPQTMQELQGIYEVIGLSSLDIVFK